MGSILRTLKRKRKIGGIKIHQFSLADILDYVFGNCFQLSSTQFLYSNRFIIIGNSETRIVFMLLFLCICSQFIT